MEVEEQIAQALQQSSLPPDIISHIQSCMANTKAAFDVSQPEGIAALCSWLEHNIPQSNTQEVLSNLKSQLETWITQHPQTTQEQAQESESVVELLRSLESHLVPPEPLVATSSALDSARTGSGSRSSSRHSSISADSVEPEDFVPPAPEDSEIHIPIPINLYDDQSNCHFIFQKKKKFHKNLATNLTLNVFLKFLL
jgi:hypothetical protein